MRELFIFLMWLFSFWTWKDFFVRWLWSPTSYPANRKPVEHLPFQEGQQESKFAQFLSSLPEDGCSCHYLDFDGDSKVTISFGCFNFILIHGIGTEASYREFLDGVSSSEIVFCEEVRISLSGDNSCNHMEAFANAYCQSRNKFRKLDFYCQDGSAVRFAKCVSTMFLGNNAIQHFHLVVLDLNEEMGKELAMKFVAIIALPHNIQILKSFGMNVSKLDGEGMEQLLKPFQCSHSVLEDLGFISLTSNVQFEHIGGMLASSTSLKTLGIFTNPTAVQKPFIRGYSSIAVALCSNQSLETLHCEISNSMELKVLLDPLIPNNNSLHCNTTLTRLRLWESIGGKEGIKTLVDMIHTNTSLLELGLHEVDDLSLHDIQGIENVLAILEALKSNKSLKRIDFYKCNAVTGYKVLGAMMDLLLENHNIEDIDLFGTGLNESGDAHYVTSALSKKKKMKLYGIVQSMAIVNPTSGRVFLCGQPFAGKTRLLMSMKQLKEFKKKDEIPNRSQTKGKIRNIFKMSNLPKGPTEDMPLERTDGIEVESILCDGFGITIWDMAGQIDYHSFHELVMSNLSTSGSSSMFLLTCNPMKQSTPSEKKYLSDIKLELEFWLRFIASNTRRSLCYRSHVSIVMTHFDYWMDDHAFAQCIDDVVVELKSQFQEILEFDEDKFIFKVDGRKESHAYGVFDFMRSYMKQLLERLPKTISACEEVQRSIALWNADHSKQPLLNWEEFCESMCQEVEELNDVDHELGKRKREFVAIYLNDGGHVIYDEKDGVVITNPHWFCHQIIGQFLHQCAVADCKLEMVSTDGIISIEPMKRLILNLLECQGNIEKQFDDILGMMKKLHICYLQDVSSIMIPSTLKHKHKKLSWSTNDELTNLKYVGRRLACKDGIRTMLTLGFFTRLQVSFFQKLDNKNAQDTYELFQDIIKFISGGIEVILQFHHGDIDILLRSHQHQDKILEFLENGIVMHIKLLQEDPTLGCPGVCLIEYILRPECVKRLVNAKDRKNQCVLVKDLQANVMMYGVHAVHNWKSCEGLDIGYDKVSTLLGSLAWKSLLERRLHDLQDFHKRIHFRGTETETNESNSNVDEVQLSTISLWETPQRLVYGPLDEKLDNIRRAQREHYKQTMSKMDEYHKETMSKLDNLMPLIQNLEHDIENMQVQLLKKVCSMIDDLMAYSVEMRKSQIPKLPYFCKFGERKLLTQFVPNLNRIELHLMCENIYGFHEVPNQEGCVVYFGTNYTRRFLAMVAWGLKIVIVLTKIGAHVSCGMGAMVPYHRDESSLQSLIFDSPNILDYHLPIATLESLPSDAIKHSRISIDVQTEAQRWLQAFLEPMFQNKRDFYEKFRLKKVCYKDSRGSTAWICDQCISMHHYEIVELE